MILCKRKEEKEKSRMKKKSSLVLGRNISSAHSLRNWGALSVKNSVCCGNSFITISRRRKSLPASSYYQTEKHNLKAAKQRFINLISEVEKKANDEKALMNGVFPTSSDSDEKSCGAFCTALPPGARVGNRKLSAYSTTEENLFHELGISILKSEVIPSGSACNAPTFSSSNEYSSGDEENSMIGDPCNANDRTRRYKLFLSHIIESGIKAKVPIKQLMEYFTRLPWRIILRLDEKSGGSDDENLTFGTIAWDIAVMLSYVHSETLLHLVKYASEQWIECNFHTFVGNATVDYVGSSKDKEGGGQVPSEMSSSVVFRALEEEIFSTYRTYLLSPLSVMFSSLRPKHFSDSKEQKNKENPIFFSSSAGKNAILEAVMILCKTMAQQTPSFGVFSFPSQPFGNNRSLWRGFLKGKTEAGEWALHFFMMYWLPLRTERNRSEAIPHGFLNKGGQYATEHPTSRKCRETILLSFGVLRILLETLEGKEGLYKAFDLTSDAILSSDASFFAREMNRLTHVQRSFIKEKTSRFQRQMFSLFEEVVEWSHGQEVRSQGPPTINCFQASHESSEKRNDWSSVLSSPLLAKCILSVIGPLSRTAVECLHSDGFSSYYLFYQHTKHVWVLLLQKTDLGYSHETFSLCQDALHGLLTCLVRCFETNTSLLGSSSGLPLRDRRQDESDLPFSLSISDSEVVLAELEDLMRIHRENTSWVTLPPSVPRRHSADSRELTKVPRLTPGMPSVVPLGKASLDAVAVSGCNASEEKNWTRAIHCVLMKAFALSGRSDISFLLLNRLLSPGTRNFTRRDSSNEWLAPLLFSPPPRCCSPSTVLFGEQLDSIASQINYILPKDERIEKQTPSRGILLESYEDILWKRIQSFDAQGFFASSCPPIRTDYYHLIVTALFVLREKCDSLTRFQSSDSVESAASELEPASDSLHGLRHVAGNAEKIKRCYHLLSHSFCDNIYEVRGVEGPNSSTAVVSIHRERTLFLRLLGMHMELGKRLLPLSSNALTTSLSSPTCNPDHLLKCLYHWTGQMPEELSDKSSHVHPSFLASESSPVIPFPIIDLLSEITFQLQDLYSFRTAPGKEDAIWRKLLSWCQHTVTSWCRRVVISEVCSVGESGKYRRRLQVFQVPLLDLISEPFQGNNNNEKNRERHVGTNKTFEGSNWVGIQFPSFSQEGHACPPGERNASFSSRLLTSVKSLEDIENFVRGIGEQLETASATMVEDAKLHDLAKDSVDPLKNTYFVISMKDFVELLILREIWVESLFLSFNVTATARSIKKDLPLSFSSPFFKESSMEDVWNRLFSLPAQSSFKHGETRRPFNFLQNAPASWSLIVASPLEWEKHFGRIGKKKNAQVSQKTKSETVELGSNGCASVNKENSWLQTKFSTSEKDDWDILMLHDVCAVGEKDASALSRVQSTSPVMGNISSVQASTFPFRSSSRSVLEWLQDWTHRSLPFGEEEPFFSPGSVAAGILSSPTYIRWAYKTLYCKNLYSLFFQSAKSPQMDRDESSTPNPHSRCLEPQNAAPVSYDDDDWQVLSAFATELSEYPSLQSSAIKSEK